MVLQCSKLFCLKVSSEYLQQDSQSSYSFGNTVYYSFIQIQNVGETKLSEENIYCFVGERFHISFSYLNQADFSNNCAHCAKSVKLGRIVVQYITLIFC